MSHVRILELLKNNFDFRENHILILEALEKEDLTADEISKKTNIPKGRIYDFINFLLENEIIVSKGKHPKTYCFMPVTDSVRDYLEQKFRKTVQDDKRIKDMLKTEEKRIIPINNSEDMIPLLRKMLIGRSKFNIVTNLHPHVFYTNDDVVFKRFSDYLIDWEFSMSANKVLNFIIRNAFWEAYYNNAEFIYVLDDDVIADYKRCLGDIFSVTESKEILEKVKKVLNKNMIQVYLSKVKNPFYMVITEAEVLLVTIAKRSIEGALIINKDISKVYQTMFRDHLSKSKNILELWDLIF